ncbi:hypothetical protein NE237_007740 [Protea cynaroides]|uniref:Uncharacterized protein n=1 Tax=Protea cynaroides TaxID=273540 RepID=A0A9Q0KQM7_9MAGN|nr:hypothetical protein NE237_007740 [Protea cynaroides]
MQLHRLLSSEKSLEMVLAWIQSLNPKIMTVVEQEANHNQPEFLDRFTEALYYYSTIATETSSRLFRFTLAMVISTETGGATINGGRCWWCSKNDFLAEESFKSRSNYFKALQESKIRLKDRLLARSLDDTELNQVRFQSRHSMKKTLTWWDLLWFSLGAVMGPGIFVFTGLTSREQASPAVVLSFFAFDVSALLSLLCYTKFTVEIPVAGGSFAYLRVELGNFVAFIGA